MNGRDQYTWDALRLLAKFQFSPSAVARLWRGRIVTGRHAELLCYPEPAVLVPTDIPAPLTPTAPWNVPFGSTTLTLWNPVDCPGPDWLPVPESRHPLWWRSSSGALLPAWNFWANVRDLLTFREDREISVRDIHDRLPVDASPRSQSNLLSVPAANDANAALLDAVLSMDAGLPPRLSLPEDALMPVAVSFSHDCDQLRGNDVYTQAIRLHRATSLLLRGHWKQGGRHLRASTQNFLHPDRFFAGSLRGMLDLERQFGFRSVSYFLTGAGGRYGARSGDAAAVRAIYALPRGWEAGVHFNYHTLKSASDLERELAFVRSARREQPVIAGRAHYLRFNPLASPRLLERHGVRYDESIGWASKLSYKAGIAGPFRFFDAATDGTVDVVEMPMICMDSTLASAGGMETFGALYDHLRAVGGVMSVLFHPGTLFNPEYPEFDGLYYRVLSRFFAGGGRSWLPSEVVDVASEFGSLPASR